MKQSLLLITLFLIFSISAYAQYTGDVCTGGTASASTAYTYNVAANAFDDTYSPDNDDSRWGSNGADLENSPDWLKYDFGEGNEKVIIQYRFYTSNDIHYNPDDWIFQGSNNDADWDDLDTQTAQQTALNTWHTYNGFVNVTAYRYYRFWVTGSGTVPPSAVPNQFVDFEEVEMMEADGSLPVELTSLTAKQIGRDVIIKWTTESEIDHLGFIVERKISKAGEWTKIADYLTDSALAGQGNSTTSRHYTVTDQDVKEGSYTYRLSDVSIDGSVTINNSVDKYVTSLPNQTSLKSLYPNPFNPQTRITFDLQADSDLNLTIYNVNGQVVKTLVNEYRTAGTYNLDWNGSDNTGITVPSGTYFIVLKAGNTVKTQKVLMLR